MYDERGANGGLEKDLVEMPLDALLEKERELELKLLALWNLDRSQYEDEVYTFKKDLAYLNLPVQPERWLSAEGSGLAKEFQRYHKERVRKEYLVSKI